MNWRTLTGLGQPRSVSEGVRADIWNSRETTVEIQTAAGWDTNPSVEVHCFNIFLLPSLRTFLPYSVCYEILVLL